MQSPEKPKRRMVVYVSEEIFERLNQIAIKESRSISRVAEMKIASGLGINSEKLPPPINIPEQTGQDRSNTNLKEIKTSVIDVLNNLPEENLSILAKKLENILSHTGMYRSVPVRTEKARIDPDQNLYFSKQRGVSIEIVTEILKKGEDNLTPSQKLAIQLNEFLQKSNLSQRLFKEKFGVDITQMGKWVRGIKSMGPDTQKKIELILSSSSLA
jgi:Trp operon repressor